MDRKYGRGARVVACATGIALAGSAANATIVFQQNFEAAQEGYGFNKSTRNITPTGRGFLGEFGNESVTLSLSGLGEHDALEVAFDLYLIRSWDGNQPLVGPDIFSFGVQGGPTLLRSSFAVQPIGWERPQSYPAAAGAGDHAMGTGAAEFRSLGYTWASQGNDAVYRFSFLIPHASENVMLWFAAEGLQGLDDESWGLDNVSVGLVPAPGALALMGLAGLAGARRRR